MSSTALPLQAHITGVVLTRNGQRLIEQCLASLSFCHTILVVDSGSTDETMTIARRFGARVVENAWPGFANQFTFAHSLVETDWFFILDQDEICPPALGQCLQQAVAQATQHTNEGTHAPVAFSVGRKSWYFDRFLQHSGWYPDIIARVFRRGLVTFSQDAHIHYHPKGETMRVGTVGEELIHYPYTSFFHHLEKLNVYAQQGAESLLARGKPGGITKGLLHGAGRFLRIYVLKRGFLDGKAGFLVAVHGAFYAFLKYARVLQASWGEPFNHH